VDARAKLIRQLQNAYSGELAAAFAYRGHWHSVSDPGERARIHQIEVEEWHHRDLVGGLLRDLGAKPRRMREAVFYTIGRVLGVMCHVSGWFAPMYGAGRLERHNIVEYEDAAQFAQACGREDFIDCLLTMAEVEWEHELYFRSRVMGHRLLRWIKVWDPAPPKETIRAKFSKAA
jgi:demethoxyubiquinone hydroxylase (CLK1/Coq7/Cat5 family)